MENMGLGLSKWLRDGGEEKKKRSFGGPFREKILKRSRLGYET